VSLARRLKSTFRKCLLSAGYKAILQVRLGTSFSRSHCVSKKPNMIRRSIITLTPENSPAQLDDGVDTPLNAKTIRGVEVDSDRSNVCRAGVCSLYYAKLDS
jgi:hypothetical protein